MDDLERLALLVRQRNEVEVEITRIIGRPAQIGQIGEYIAAKVFRIAMASPLRRRATMAASKRDR